MQSGVQRALLATGRILNSANRCGAAATLVRGAVRTLAEIAGKLGDRLLHVRTEDYIELDAPRAGALAVPDIDVESCFPYEPTSHLAFRRLMRRVPVTVDGHEFIDLGCGLGRVVIEAATYPFARVVGVELSEAMADAARRNVAHARHRPRRAAVEVRAGDARDVRFAHGPYVVYLFNPFGADVLHAVVANMEAAIRDRGVEITVIYYNCEYAQVLRRSAAFREVRTGRLRDWSAARVCDYAMFTSTGAAVAAGSG
jgi:predicted RNA methylase